MRPADILAASGGSPAGPVALGIFIFAAYWLPTVVALSRHVRNTGSVVIVNLLLGWTVIGWIVALAMAFRSRDHVASGT